MTGGRWKYFYPRSPCGERPRVSPTYRRELAISIHVPLAGNVRVAHKRYVMLPKFLSTFPLRGTSRSTAILSLKSSISIHVPLAGNVIRL